MPLGTSSVRLRRVSQASKNKHPVLSFTRNKGGIRCLLRSDLKSYPQGRIFRNEEVNSLCLLKTNLLHNTYYQYVTKCNSRSNYPKSCMQYSLTVFIQGFSNPASELRKCVRRMLTYFGGRSDKSITNSFIPIFSSFGTCSYRCRM